ncbi:MAG: endopeptidase La, partial [Clostridia bacterium]|nr:endopeptidase La [Clostridia bacterium]
KDGPSAGVTMTTSLTSALSGIPVRRDVAMTGEITLTGRVLAIGGLREKSTAAYTRGIRTLLIPKDNMRDIPELDQNVAREMTFLPCETLTDVLTRALRQPAYPERLPVIECAEEPEKDTKTAPLIPPMGEPARYNRI